MYRTGFGHRSQRNHETTPHILITSSKPGHSGTYHRLYSIGNEKAGNGPNRNTQDRKSLSWSEKCLWERGYSLFTWEVDKGCARAWSMGF